MEEPPFGLWLLGGLNILVSTTLVMPRFALDFIPGVPRTVALNDLLDGLIWPLLCAFVYKALFGRLKGGFSMLPFMLTTLRTLGAAAHAVANSTDIANGFSLRNTVGRHSFWWHESFAHSCFQVGEMALLTLYMYHRAPSASSDKRPPPEVDLGFEVPGLSVASLHGTAAALFLVGTRTTYAILPVWIFAAWILYTGNRQRKSMVAKYAYTFVLFSVAFIGIWAGLHDGALPTFDDINKQYIQ